MFTKSKLIDLLQTTINSVENNEVPPEVQLELFANLSGIYEVYTVNKLKRYLILGWYVDSITNKP